MSSVDTVPALPNPDDPGFNQSVKEVLETRLGHIGNILNSNPTWQDLIDSGAVGVLNNGNVVSGAGVSVGNRRIVNANNTVGADTIDPTTIITAPSRPTNVQFSEAFGNVIISWGEYETHVSFTEIHRAQITTSLPNPTFDDAVLAGTATGRVYSETLTSGLSYRYWVRFISYASVPSEVHDIDGDDVSVSQTPTVILDQLVGQLNETHLNTFLNSRIDLVDTTDGGVVTQVNDLNGNWSVKAQVDIDGRTYISGFGTSLEVINGSPVSTFIVKADRFGVGMPGSDDFIFSIGIIDGVQTVGIGNANIIDLSVTNQKVQSLHANKLFVDSGNIADLIVGDAHITNAMIAAQLQSDNFISGDPGSGWSINKNGQMELYGIKARGDIEASSIRADAVEAVKDLILNGQTLNFPVSFSDTQQYLYPLIVTGVGATGVPIETRYVPYLIGNVSGFTHLASNTSDPYGYAPYFFLSPEAGIGTSPCQVTVNYLFDFILVSKNSSSTMPPYFIVQFELFRTETTWKGVIEPTIYVIPESRRQFRFEVDVVDDVLENYFTLKYRPVIDDNLPFAYGTTSYSVPVIPSGILNSAVGYGVRYSIFTQTGRTIYVMLRSRHVSYQIIEFRE